MTRLLPAALGLGCFIGLAACSGPQVASTTSTASTDASMGVTDANAILAVANGALTAYEATPNPSQAVIVKAKSLLATAQGYLTTYGAQSQLAISAAGVFAEYLLTAAPGNGVTPASS